MHVIWSYIPWTMFCTFQNENDKSQLISTLKKVANINKYRKKILYNSVFWNKFISFKTFTKSFSFDLKIGCSQISLEYNTVNRLHKTRKEDKTYSIIKNYILEKICTSSHLQKIKFQPLHKGK